MYKIIRAMKDAYITNRRIAGKRREEASTGRANTLDLFKVYADDDVRELSRILIHFDLTSLREMVEEGKINPFDASFECLLMLRDVYGGQTTPENFEISVFPLSRSFAEGSGRDIVQYSDVDVANFLTASHESGPWGGEGCSSAGLVGSECDFFTHFGSQNLRGSQFFVTGEEDLSVDVTHAVRLMLSGELPDAGFRISFDDLREGDEKTYYVKRFAARSAYDAAYHPQLIVKFDDSYHDETQLLQFDTECKLFFHNFSMGQPQNVVSGSTFLTGSDCMMLKLITEVSGGYYEMLYDASQLYVGDVPVQGVYVSSVNVPSDDDVVAGKMELSGSVMFWPIWSSQDETINFYPERKITIEPRRASSTNPAATQYTVTTTGVKSDLFTDEELHVRVNFFDPYSKLSRVVKSPIVTPGIVVRDTFWSIRNADTNRTVIPFDGVKHSTRLSSDADGLWFKLDGSNFVPGYRYVIDIMTVVGGQKKTYHDVSPIFRCRERK